MLQQNVIKHNRDGRAFCKLCLPEKSHGMSSTTLFRKWCSMKHRATDPLDANYGGRGVWISESWMAFENFYRDMGPSYAPGLTIERIDVNKGYCKENCTWVTPLAQQANKRTNRVLLFQGKLVHLAELCRITGHSKSQMLSRLAKGMSAEEAVAHASASTYGTGRHAMKSLAEGKPPRSRRSTTL